MSEKMFQKMFEKLVNEMLNSGVSLYNEEIWLYMAPKYPELSLECFSRVLTEAKNRESLKLMEFVSK